MVRQVSLRCSFSTVGNKKAAVLKNRRIKVLWQCRGRSLCIFGEVGDRVIVCVRARI